MPKRREFQSLLSQLTAEEKKSLRRQIKYKLLIHNLSTRPRTLLYPLILYTQIALYSSAAYLLLPQHPIALPTAIACGVALALFIPTRRSI